MGLPGAGSAGNFRNWVYLRKNNPTLYYDIREDGYAQLYAVMIAKELPDTYPRYPNGTLKCPNRVVNGRKCVWRY